jgi:hypothetical protein
MTTGIQFTGTLTPNQSQSYYTWGWNPALHVVWYMMPTTPRSGAPELEWSIGVERSSATTCTYWITVKNLTNATISFEGRYAIMN